jgi:predicted metal-dependent hydrolase
MTFPTVVITGNPQWRQQAAVILAGSSFNPTLYAEHEEYVSRLVDDRVVLIIVDGDAEDWSFYAATSRASPATRRIPVIVVTADAKVAAKAKKTGANEIIAPDAIPKQLAKVAKTLARVMAANEKKLLAEASVKPLPKPAAEAIKKFNAGEYYKQHDLLEALWMKTPGPERNLYQGILQVGIAYYQISKHNRRGALKMLLRARQWLDGLPKVCQGVDVARLKRDAQSVRKKLEAISDQDIDLFDQTTLKPVVIVTTKK